MTDHVTAAEPAAALPHVLAAPKTNAPVKMLCIRPGFNQRVFPDRLRLTREAGAEGDFAMTTPWLKLPDGRGDPRMQLAIVPERVLDLVWRDRVSTVHPGDTIVADMNVTLENLPTGTLIRAGTAVLRVSDLWNDGCVKWKVRYGQAAYDWIIKHEHEPLRLRGILCSVEQDGEVAMGDALVVV